MRTLIERGGSTVTRFTVLAALASASLLAACDRSDDGRTAGQRLDDVVASTERQADDAGRTVRQAGQEAGQAIGQAGEVVANKSRDMAITTAINAKLAADERLSALRINVDTADGRVVLRGTAPDTEARNRASTLARSVDGVGEVSNELTVQPRN